LPTLIELESIVNYGRSAPAIDTTAFPNTPSNYFWSSSLPANNPSAAWVVAFYLGHTNSSPMPTANRVRCVR
jgi:hypothetical protein